MQYKSVNVSPESLYSVTSTDEEHFKLLSVLVYLPSGSSLKNKVSLLISLTPDVFCGQNYSHPPYSTKQTFEELGFQSFV